MTITRIDNTNRSFFGPFLLEASERSSQNILRLGAIEDGVACGAAAFEINDVSAELLTLFVAPDYRRRGIGRALLDAFTSLTVNTDVASLAVSFMPEEKDGLTDFFTAAGFECFGGSPVLSLDYEDTKNCSTLDKYLLKADRSGIALSVDELSDIQRHQLDSTLRSYGTSLGEVEVGSFSPELSFAYFNNGSLLAGMFCSMPGDQLNIDFLFSRVANAGPTLTIIDQLVRSAAERESIRRVAFLAANPVVPAIAEELFGHAVSSNDNMIYAVRLLAQNGQGIA